MMFPSPVPQVSSDVQCVLNSQRVPASASLILTESLSLRWIFRDLLVVSIAKQANECHADIVTRSREIRHTGNVYSSVFDSADEDWPVLYPRYDNAGGDATSFLFENVSDHPSRWCKNQNCEHQVGDMLVMIVGCYFGGHPEKGSRILVVRGWRSDLGELRPFRP